MYFDQLVIRAHIELIATSDGGRHSPLCGPVSYRPNHNFFGEDSREMCMGAVDLSDNQTVAPGGALDVEMILLAWPALSKNIQVGRRWRIQEGA